MEFVLDFRESMIGGRVEKIIAILLSVVLAEGLLVDGHRYLTKAKPMITEELIVVSEENVIEDSAVVSEAEIIEELVAGAKSAILEKPTVKVEAAVLEEPTVKVEAATLGESMTVSEEVVLEKPVVKEETAALGESMMVSEEVVLEKLVAKEDAVFMEEPTVESDILQNTEHEIEMLTDFEMIESVLAEHPSEAQSPFLIDEEGMIYGFQPEYADLSDGCLQFPSKGCIGIRKGTFAGCTEHIAEVVIPAGITVIEEGTLTEIISLEWITTESGNSSYTTYEGVLFNCDGTELIAFPPARVGGYLLPQQVVSIDENAFQNTLLDTIDLRQCELSENCLLNISESCSIIR